MPVLKRSGACGVLYTSPLRRTCICRSGFSRRSLLFLSWLVGLCVGIAFGFRAGVSPSPWELATARMDCLSAILSLAFWPVVSYLLALFFPWRILLLAAFLRGASLAYVWCVLYGVFQPVGWLFAPLYMLAELLMAPILFFLWLRLLPGSPGRSLYLLLLCLALAVLGGAAQYWLVMPASAFLIKGTFQ